MSQAPGIRKSFGSLVRRSTEDQAYSLSARPKTVIGKLVKRHVRPQQAGNFQGLDVIAAA
jgi:hypothetical protein